MQAEQQKDDYLLSVASKLMGDILEEQKLIYTGASVHFPSMLRPHLRLGRLSAV